MGNRIWEIEKNSKNASGYLRREMPSLSEEIPGIVKISRPPTPSEITVRTSSFEILDFLYFQCQKFQNFCLKFGLGFLRNHPRFARPKLDPSFSQSF